MPPTIVLIGFKGSGKSTVGRALSEKLDAEFLDTDAIIEQLHEEKSGEKMNFRSIFIAHGSDYFEQMEATAIKRAFSKTGHVVSLGGRAMMNHAFVDIERSHTVLVNIAVESDTLFKRIMKDGAPAFFDPDDPEGSFKMIYAQRADMYEHMSNITVDNTSGSPEETADEIVEWLDTL